MNTLKLPVSELKGALAGLGKIIGRRSTLPVLQHVRVSRDTKGTVSLQATDLDRFVTYTAADAQIGPALDLLLPMSDLTNAVKSSSAKDEMALTVDAKGGTKVRYFIGGSPVEQEMATLSVKEWPPVPEISKPGSALDREFGLVLKQALECCSNDSSRYILNGVCLDVADKKLHYIVSTNGRVLYSANSFCFDLQENVIIPDSRFLTSSDFLEAESGLLSVGTGKDINWVKLQSARWTYISKQIEGNYPNWKQVVPKDNAKATKILLNEAAQKQLLAIAPKLPGDNDDNRPVRIRFDLQNIYIEGKGRDQKEWTSIHLPEAVAKGRQAMVMVNREYLLKAVRFGLKQVEIEDELSPVVFWNAGKKMVVMPVRMDSTPATSPANPAPAKPAEQSNSQPTTETNERTTMRRQTSRVSELTRVTGQVVSGARWEFDYSFLLRLDMAADDSGLVSPAKILDREKFRTRSTPIL